MEQVLVYQSGGHFVRNRCKRASPNVFARMVIQLPSIHTGGELVVYEMNSKANKVANLGQSAREQAYSMYFAAHCIDSQFELREVVTGYRVELVYSLSCVRGRFCLSLTWEKGRKIQK